MFIKGDDNLSFSDIAEVIDIGRASNVDHIGLMTPGITAERLSFNGSFNYSEAVRGQLCGIHETTRAAA